MCVFLTMPEMRIPLYFNYVWPIVLKLLIIIILYHDPVLTLHLRIEKEPMSTEVGLALLKKTMKRSAKVHKNKEQQTSIGAKGYYLF